MSIPAGCTSTSCLQLVQWSGAALEPAQQRAERAPIGAPRQGLLPSCCLALPQPQTPGRAGEGVVWPNAPPPIPIGCDPGRITGCKTSRGVGWKVWAPGRPREGVAGFRTCPPASWWRGIQEEQCASMGINRRNSLQEYIAPTLYGNERRGQASSLPRPLVMLWAGYRTSQQHRRRSTLARACTGVLNCQCHG